MNIVIPMAGKGKRFKDAGYDRPKPFINMKGDTMLGRVVYNIDESYPVAGAEFIFIVRDSHMENYNWAYYIRDADFDARIVTTDGLTEGATSSVLLATDLIDNDKELLIASVDQIVDDPGYIGNAVEYFRKKQADGGSLCFWGNHPKWSYLDYNGEKVTWVAEKNPISTLANVGIYYWKKGADFVRCAKKMIERNIRVNGEFYNALVYNQLIQEGGLVLPYFINEMHGLGTPEDLEKYLEVLNEA